MIANSFKRRISAPGIRLRLIALLCLAVGISAVWYFNHDTQTTKRFLVHLPPKPAPQETILKNRNLSEYEAGGRFSTCNGVEDRIYEKCVNVIEQAREFIWQHWKEKKRGYIVYDFTGVDTMNEFHFFIEPDESGNWRVVQRWKQFQPSPNPLRIYETKEEAAPFIKRRPATKKTKVYEPGKFNLLFLNQYGEEIDAL